MKFRLQKAYYNRINFFPKNSNSFKMRIILSLLFYIFAFFWLILFNQIFLNFVLVVFFLEKSKLFIFGVVCNETHFTWLHFFVWLAYFGIKLYFSQKNKSNKNDYFSYITNIISDVFFSFWALDCIFLSFTK